MTWLIEFFSMRILPYDFKIYNIDMSWMIELISSPLRLLSGLCALINVSLSLFCLFKIYSLKNSKQLEKIGNHIDTILFNCFLMIFFILIDRFFLVLFINETFFSSTARAGDIRVVVAGTLQFLYNILFHLALASFFLLVWFVLKGLYNSKISRLP